ncbi:MAG: hypothetical protein JWO31_1632, partial [Phycisphaerales bacterium]|nr:hypothetical protein [Phycisphaerales bacterium]
MSPTMSFGSSPAAADVRRSPGTFVYRPPGRLGGGSGGAVRLATAGP